MSENTHGSNREKGTRDWKQEMYSEIRANQNTTRKVYLKKDKTYSEYQDKKGHILLSKLFPILEKHLNLAEEHFKQSSGYGEFKDLVGCQIIAEEKDKEISHLKAEKDKINAYWKAYREANKDKIKAYKKAYYKNVVKPKKEASR